jgi:hypothetical protein
MKTYRAALVGTGSIGDAHVRAVESSLGRVKLEAAVDIDSERVRAFAERHQIPNRFTDYAEMLKKVRPDIVLVATPPAQHKPMSIAAMETGAGSFARNPCAARSPNSTRSSRRKSGPAVTPPPSSRCGSGHRPRTSSG